MRPPHIFWLKRMLVLAVLSPIAWWLGTQRGISNARTHSNYIPRDAQEHLELCKDDASIIKGRIRISNQTEQIDVGMFRHKLHLESLLPVRAYALVRSTPSMDAEFGSMVQVLDKDPLIVETTPSSIEKLVLNEIEISSSYLDSYKSDDAGSQHVVGLFPVKGHSEITQTPERLLTHSSEQGDYYAIDIKAKRGVDVVTFVSGTVIFQYDEYNDQLSCGDEHATRYTNKIHVKQDDGLEARYVHLAEGSVRVSEGQRIEAGQIIADVGCFNGCEVDRAHLHLEVGGMTDEGWRSLPLKFFDEIGGVPREPKLGDIRNL